MKWQNTLSIYSCGPVCPSKICIGSIHVLCLVILGSSHVQCTVGKLNWHQLQMNSNSIWFSFRISGQSWKNKESRLTCLSQWKLSHLPADIHLFIWRSSGFVLMLLCIYSVLLFYDNINCESEMVFQRHNFVFLRLLLLLDPSCQDFMLKKEKVYAYFATMRPLALPNMAWGVGTNQPN